MEAETQAPPSVSTSDEIALTSAMFGRAECLSNKCMEWTDEKHSLYLKSMEASFVNQLYESNQRNPPSGQFKILQGGCWDKISFERGDVHYPNKLAAAGNPHHDVLAADHPWILRLRPQQNPPYKISFERGTDAHYPNKLAAAGNRHHDVLAADPWIRRLRPQQNPPSKQHYYCPCTSNNTINEPSHDTEVSDQNFDDSDEDDDNNDVKGANECSSNRMKMFHS